MPFSEGAGAKGKFDIRWLDAGRWPTQKPDPAFPDGRDMDGVGAKPVPSCRIELPYPAKRCGGYVVVCETCGFSIYVSTAGRADDPRSVRVPCKLPAKPGRGRT